MSVQACRLCAVRGRVRPDCPLCGGANKMISAPPKETTMMPTIIPWTWLLAWAEMLLKDLGPLAEPIIQQAVDAYLAAHGVPQYVIDQINGLLQKYLGAGHVLSVAPGANVTP